MTNFAELDAHNSGTMRRWLVSARMSARMSVGWAAAMLTIIEAQQRTELFLTGQMLEALRAVEYELPSFDIEPVEVELAEMARSRVEIRHVRGAPDATYLVHAYQDELLMQLQLNVHRLVVVYRVPGV